LIYVHSGASRHFPGQNFCSGCPAAVPKLQRKNKELILKNQETRLRKPQ
jgi:hypothetical protein